MDGQDTPLVSVVVPVYNVEKYLDSCLESIVRQSYQKLEIILIDDGSRDSCPAKCDAWAELDSRIKVVHKENQGLGMARNSGLKEASGKYICFFDSDDFIDVDTIDQAVRAALSDNAEIVLFGMRSVANDGLTVLSEAVPSCPRDHFEGDEVQHRFLPFLIGHSLTTGEDWCLMASACICLMDRGMLSACGFRFASEREIISEDVYSLLWLYRYVKSVSVINRAFYNYRVNNASLTHAYNPQRLDRIAHFYRKSRDLAYACGYDEEVVERLVIPYSSFVIAALKQLSVADAPRQEKIEQVSDLSSSEEFRSAYATLKAAKIGLKKKMLFSAVKRGNSRLVLCICMLQMQPGRGA